MCLYIIDKVGEGVMYACVQINVFFCLIDYNCIIILLSVIVFVCHDKGNVFFVT